MRGRSHRTLVKRRRRYARLRTKLRVFARDLFIHAMHTAYSNRLCVSSNDRERFAALWGEQ